MDESVDESMDESEDAHPYTVEAPEPLQQAAVPLRFDRMPREMQSEVLKRTHARFEVTHHMEEIQSALGLCPETDRRLRRLPFVPVVLRYEFILQRRLADGPRMKARISRSLDPALKQTALWQTFAPETQARIERAPARVRESQWFSELFYDGIHSNTWVFCFVHTADGRRSVDTAPRWTRFPRNSEVLDEVRAKMQRVFCLPCEEFIHWE
jgi:hypothetical protein